MISGSIQVPRTAHYSQTSEAGPETQEIWLACHGYGQLPPYFIRPFAAVVPDNVVVVAPEGLSKFYLDGFSGRIGASWMTRENRQDEIEDYCRYLDLLLAQILEKCPENTVINAFGFSQGAATICRWLAASKYTCQKLVLWAGAFPPDVDMKVAAPALSDTEFIFVHGNQDELVTEERLQENLAMLAEIAIYPDVIRFDGGHAIDREVLRRVILFKNEA